ncbi:NAD+ diphosphatase [Bifidobacterium commune]|uniref:NAD(+) diphosphatase n=1 Tax=Bifidobacterium commune TaxID=1505727 RepID=A0A1C4H5B3_9BIFI|nr:NAD(+) diphosphatase [Bifidobacterium commune]MBB2955539.1 NAD+ diphosphatase [Bifidobacterium commune]SCC79983.1 NAD+ diphosphatase [Bifidobacterium commune]
MATSFSSLALTQTLSFLPLVQGDTDYRAERREEPGLIETVLAQHGTTVIFVRDGMLAVPNGQAAKVDFETAAVRLASVPGDYVLRGFGGKLDALDVMGVIAVFLGAHGDDPDNVRQVVAFDVSGLAHDGDAQIDRKGGNQAYFAATDLLDKVMGRFDWVALQDFAPHSSAREVGWATTAVALSMWHAAQLYCPRCGSPVLPANAGWAQRCTNEGCRANKSLLFPRVEPAVIVSIVDGQDRLLLQHNKAWKDPARYSVCAGFVEAGENLEHACRREAEEETGLKLGEVKYLGSQPWPFPASLMVAFKARALSVDIQVDRRETTEAAFFTRDEFTEALVSGRIVPPGKSTIARYMIEEWYGRKL